MPPSPPPPQVPVESVVELVCRQPLLLCAQPTTIAAALEVVRTVLLLEQRDALAVLVRAPALLYDFTVDTMMARVEALGATFGKSLVSCAEMRCDDGRTCAGGHAVRADATLHFCTGGT